MQIFQQKLMAIINGFSHYKVFNDKSMHIKWCVRAVVVIHEGGQPTS